MCCAKTLEVKEVGRKLDDNVHSCSPALARRNPDSERSSNLLKWHSWREGSWGLSPGSVSPTPKAKLHSVLPFGTPTPWPSHSTSYSGGHVISTALTNEGFPDRILKMGGVSWGRELTKKKTLPRKVACQSSQCMGADGKRAAGVCISSLKLLKLLIRKHRTSLTSQVNFCKMDSSLGALYGINKIFQTSKHSIRHCRNDNEQSNPYGDIKKHVASGSSVIQKQPASQMWATCSIFPPCLGRKRLAGRINGISTHPKYPPTKPS
ncbi:uncharacterized protein LOC112622583 [Theropithecus gelada]|uniref:uncharacterized protein LOC112622583 n=1 Tax=Theropithecus gelada TaxID=9565 RepID=UPI000DC16F9E|nr:uncharacterized protein LOC112622583 [Theropithecus gelada]